MNTLEPPAKLNKIVIEIFTDLCSIISMRCHWERRSRCWKKRTQNLYKMKHMKSIRDICIKEKEVYRTVMEWWNKIEYPVKSISISYFPGIQILQFITKFWPNLTFENLKALTKIINTTKTQNIIKYKKPWFLYA